LDQRIEAPESLTVGVQGFIFDLDGTLFESRSFARRLVLARPGEALVSLAEYRTRKTLYGCDYGSAEAYYEEFFSRMSRRIPERPEKLRAWFFDRYMPRICGILKDHYRLRPGTGGLFEDLSRASFPFAVYSDYPLAQERLAALGLEPGHGGRLYGPEHFGAQKPAVRPFLSIARDLKVPPDRTLVIGDREDTDGTGAAAAGMAYIGIRNHRDQRISAFPLLRWELCVTLLREGLGL
jgi:FMN phosphatase YigB (HAD superfamily)